jgi:hypothetical protein
LSPDDIQLHAQHRQDISNESLSRANDLGTTILSLSGSDDTRNQYLRAVVTDCAIGLIEPFPIDVNAALNGR